jgi:hypothetical protein
VVSTYAQESQVMICDLQEQIVARRKTTKPDALSQSAQVLCQMAQLFKLPLTFSVVPENKNAPKLIASLQAFASEKNQFLRATASPFIDPATREHLASLRRPTLIIAGFATEVVVLHAALDALREGYGVIVAVMLAVECLTEPSQRRLRDPGQRWGRVVRRIAGGSGTLSTRTPLYCPFSDGITSATFKANFICL